MRLAQGQRRESMVWGCGNAKYARRQKMINNVLERPALRRSNHNFAATPGLALTRSYRRNAG